MTAGVMMAGEINVISSSACISIPDQEDTNLKIKQLTTGGR